ncbi:MAG: poly-gamma-glutamate hydrolase family protein [Dactylosporangium sp.]|nr:poly-gamma-glutamate hydrolase family protein [Dactylosporangium sp.]NNJ61381.1 poly-gamma-glutamate hydrolase family protein [Dactylosporangium sp.]
MGTSRRAFLAAGLGAAATTPFVVDLTSRPASAATTQDTYASNTDLYQDSDLTEGTDYGRRYRRAGLADNSYGDQVPFTALTTVIAPHGGGIEPGTSELCLAIAGLHPGTLDPAPAGGPAYDFWMFEGLLASGNSALHVTSTHCDDDIARSLCAGSKNVLALHGCTPSVAGLESDAEAIMVGGGNPGFKQVLIEELTTAQFAAFDAETVPAIAGTSADNIVNRNLLSGGGQLELTTPLRSTMFTINTRAGRGGSTTQAFWDFVNATRTAIARLEAEQTVW